MSQKKIDWIWKFGGLFIGVMAVYFAMYGFADRTGIIAVSGWALFCSLVISGGMEALFFWKWDENQRDKCLKFLNAGILIVAAVAYFLLAWTPCLMYDEAYSVAMIRRSFKEIVEITSQDVHSPFYYFVLKIFYDTIGFHRVESVKVFSELFFILTLVVGARICRKHYGRKVECYWLILTGFMPAMVVQATNARMYTFGLFFVTCGGYLAYSIYRRESLNKYLLFTLCSVLAVYVHTYCMLIMVLIYATLLLFQTFRKNWKSVGRVFASGVAVSLLYLPWLLVLFHQFRRWTGAEAGWGNHLEGLSWKYLEYFLNEWFSSMETPQPLAILFGVAVILCVSGNVWTYAKKKKDYFPVAAPIILIIVVLVSLIVSKYVVPCFLGRYVFPLFAGVWLYVAVGLELTRGRVLGTLVAASVVLAGFFTYRTEYRLEKTEGLDQYLNDMQENYEPGDIILVDTFSSMMMSVYMPDATYMLYGSAPKCIPFAYDDIFREWSQLEGHSKVWYLSLTSFRAGNIEEYYRCEERKEYQISCYTFVLEKMVYKDL